MLSNDPNSLKLMQLSHDSWRVFRIVSEFVEGFEKMTAMGPSVTIFGSARLKEGSIYYSLAREVAREIGARGLAVITGGGPGLMEAANRGAKDAAAASCGLCIDLPFEFESNCHVDREWRLRFRYFFVRKVMFVRYARAFIALPGGLGTLDELFEALTLIQTKKTHPFPVFLMGKRYWSGLIEWIQSNPLELGCISPEDLDRLTISDDPKYVADRIEQHWKAHPHLTNF